MKKTLTFAKPSPLPSFERVIGWSFPFNMVDSSLVKAPEEQSRTTAHHVEVTASFELVAMWGFYFAGGVSEQSEKDKYDLMKVLFEHGKRYVVKKLQDTGELEQIEQLKLITPSPEMRDRFDPSRIQDPVGATLEVDAAVNIGQTLEKIGVVSEKPSERQLLIQLRQILATRFDDGELHTLSFDLGVDYDSLPGVGKANKAREIVDYLNRHNRIADLVKAIKEQRPDIPLDDTSDKKSTDRSLLEELLNKLPVIRNLDFYHPDFQTWHTTVKLSLRRVFDESFYLVTEYDKIAWHTSDKLEDADEQRNLFLRSCIAAEGILRTAVNM